MEALLVCLSRLRIRTRITLGFALLLAVTAGLTALSWSRFETIESGLKDFAREADADGAVRDVRAAVIDISETSLRYVMTGNVKDLAKAKSDLEGLASAYDSIVKQYGETPVV